MSAVKILALDPDDLVVVSALVQDMVLTVGDMAYEPKAHRFVFVGNRFDKQAALAGTPERRRAAVTISGVKAARTRNIRMDAPLAVVSLLAIQFTPSGLEPEGTLELTFAGGGAVALEVECVEVHLEDLESHWSTPNTPHHDIAELKDEE